jgi:2OG-Fe(II) oxygenase superfamily
VKIQLDEVLDSRRWRLRHYPFKHIWAESVFRRVYYQQMVEEFRHLLSITDGSGFRRDMPGYDATECSFRPGYSGAFDPMLSHQLHASVARILGVTITGDINAALHYHAAGGASGQVHNDLNPGWFLSQPSENEVNLSNNTRCSYRHGTTSELGVDRVELVRAVAVIFYLNNGSWTPGHGGETGLYVNRTDEVAKPAVLIPPMDNALIAFECTPSSYHAYLAARTPRSSLALWLHRCKEDAVARWGERSIVYWPKEFTT